MSELSSLKTQLRTTLDDIIKRPVMFLLDSIGYYSLPELLYWAENERKKANTAASSYAEAPPQTGVITQQ